MTTQEEAIYNPASLRLADAISRHDFTEREWRVLEFLRKASFGAGRPSAYVPRLELFCVATSITRGNVSSILRRLKACQVIREEPQWYYGFLLMPPPGDPWANWRVPIRVHEIEVIRQLEMLWPPPGLPEALRDGFIESCGQTGKPGVAPGTYETGLGASDQSAGQRPAHTGVPESGTPAQASSRSRIGNGSESPVFAGTPHTVPESGTDSPLAMANGNGPNASSKKHWNNGQWSVPESGTAALTQEELDEMALAGFSGDQQELMGLLAEAGALGPNRSSWRCWFDMIQRRFEVCLRLWADAREARLRGTVFRRGVGAYMMHYWKRWGRPND